MILVAGLLLVISQPRQPAPPPNAAEARFLAVLEQARATWINAPNDLAKNGMRAARAAALCKALPNGAAAGWSGRVASIEPGLLPDLAGHGFARIVLRLNDDVELETPENPLLNPPASLVEQGTPLYATAQTLRPGQRVVFSARFYASGTDCMAVVNLFDNGAMTAPEFKIDLTAWRAD